MPERHGRQLVTAQYKGLALGDLVIRVEVAGGGQGGVVRQFHVFGQPVGPVHQGRVESEGFAQVVVFAFFVLHALAEQGEVAVLPVLGDFAGVDFVGEVAVYQEICPGHRTQ